MLSTGHLKEFWLADAPQKIQYTADYSKWVIPQSWILKKFKACPPLPLELRAPLLALRDLSDLCVVIFRNLL